MMLGKTHLVFALFLSLFIISKFNVVQPLLFILILVFSSFIPDIDYSKSKAGKKIWPFSLIIQLIAKHRGVFHSLFIPALIWLLSYLLNLNTLGIAFFIGYSSHLFLDAFTHQGVRPLYPIKLEIKGSIHSGGLFDSFMFFFFLVMSIILLVRL